MRARQPGDPFVFSNAAEARRNRGKDNERLRSCDAAIARNPDDPAAYCNRGFVLHSLERFEEALHNYDRAIRIKPDFAEAFFNKGNALRKLRRLDEALQNYEHAVSLKPGFAEAYFNRANTQRDLKLLNEAVQSYARAIDARPDYALAHNNRGNVLRDLDRLEEAVESFDRAIEVMPEHAVARKNRGGALRALGRPGEALQSFDSAIELNPGFAEAHVDRGNVLMDLKRPEEAVESYERAIAIRPDLAAAHYNMGIALRGLKRFPDAGRSLDRALQLKPDFAEAWHQKGNVFEEIGKFDQAVLCYDRAVATNPRFSEAYNNRGRALHRLRRLEEALDSYERAINCKPDYVLAYTNRASTLSDLGRLEEAIESCNKAIELNDRFAGAYYNRGNAQKALKRLDDAIESFDRAIELEPHVAKSYWNKATCSLLIGDFEQGWPLHEWRMWHSPSSGLSPIAQPPWSGRDNIAGKILFIHAEQGFGDTIQFCRYALVAEERGAEVVLAVQDPLVRLLGSLSSTIEIVPVTAAPPAFDRHIRLLSMPLAFRTGLDDIPARVPYLRAEPDKIEKWRERIGKNGFRVGICWQGAKGGEIDIGRSFPVGHFEGLARLPNVRLISLQKNAGTEQLLDLPAGMRVEEFGDELDRGRDAFIDTAALMESLDLVIAPNTAIAHLAGALGRPTWVALSYVPDWRWMLDRSDSPWYPTVRLFRQAKRSDWSSVFADMEREVARLSQANRSAQRQPAAAPEVPVSWGELIDKITILEIKSERIAAEAALANVRKELTLLQEVAAPVLAARTEIAKLKSQLRTTNERLWLAEDNIRAMECAGDFGAGFIALARSVYTTNDERAAIKREINRNLASGLVEEKSYKSTLT